MVCRRSATARSRLSSSASLRWVNGMHGGVRFSAVQADVDVAAAGEQDAVEVRIDGLPSSHRTASAGISHGNTAGLEYGLNVGVSERS